MKKILNGIYSKDVDIAREKALELIGNQKIIHQRYFRDDFVIETDYEIYRYCRLSDNARGHRHDFAYVDTTILTDRDIEIINVVVKPSLSRGISMYQDTKLYKTENHLIDFRA